MKKILIRKNSNLKNALKQMSTTGEKCLVVVDKKNKLLGTLSDGDVRRAILNGKINEDTISVYYQKRPIFLRKENYSHIIRNQRSIGMATSCSCHVVGIIKPKFPNYTFLFQN